MDLIVEISSTEIVLGVPVCEDEVITGFHVQSGSGNELTFRWIVGSNVANDLIAELRISPTTLENGEVEQDGLLREYGRRGSVDFSTAEFQVKTSSGIAFLSKEERTSAADGLYILDSSGKLSLADDRTEAVDTVMSRCSP